MILLIVHQLLGIYIWKIQINSVVNDANRSFYAILQLKTMLHIVLLLDVYYSTMYSVLTFNVVHWGGSAERIVVLLVK